jgi:hypothetical protein
LICSSLDLHAADPRVVGRADQGGGADDEQRLGRGLLHRLAEHVDEHRDGHDRAAAPDQPEQQPDRQAEGQGE